MVIRLTWLTKADVEYGFCRKMVPGVMSSGPGRHCPEPMMTATSRVVVLHVLRELEAVENAGHIDIGKHQSDVGPMSEEEDCVICCAGLDHRESSLLEHLHQEQPK